MLAVDITTVIAADGFGVGGSTLFYGDFPTEPDACVVVSTYPGAEPITFFAEAAPAIERPRFQVRVRGAAFDYDTPAALIDAIYLALANRGAFVISGTRYLNLGPLQSPFEMGQDTNDRWIFAVSFEAHREATGLADTLLSGGDAMIHQATATLDNGQISALPTTPIEMVPTPGAGKALIVPIMSTGTGTVLVYDNLADYVNVDASAKLYFELDTVSARLFGPTGVGLFDLFAGWGAGGWVWPVGPADNWAGNDAAELPGAYEDKPLTVRIDNGFPSLGDLTGGDPLNTLAITSEFRVYDFALKKFLTVTESGWDEATRTFA